MIVVSNTSPISNLLIIGEVSLLQQIYPKVLIPPAVHAELMRLPMLQPTVVSLLGIGWLEVQAPTNLQLLDTLNQTLDPGEAEAIALAVELSTVRDQRDEGVRLLIDERLGRSVATSYELKLRGLLGILINAKQQGLIPVLQPMLDRLINQAGFRVSQALYDRTLQEVGE
jgi:predicted nucleic acid-binding protein